MKYVMNTLLIVLTIPIIYAFHYIIAASIFHRKSSTIRKKLKTFNFIQRFFLIFIYNHRLTTKVKVFVFSYWLYLTLVAFIIIFDFIPRSHTYWLYQLNFLNESIYLLKLSFDVIIGWMFLKINHSPRHLK